MDNMTGSGWTTFGAPGVGVGQFTRATNVAIDSAGHIYVVDSGNKRVVRIDDMSGQGWVTFGNSTQFSVPRGLAVR